MKIKKVVPIVRASKKDNGVTLRTSYLPKKIKIKNGDIFYIEFGDNFILKMRASRNGTTLYQISGIVENSIPTPQVGWSVAWEITNIVRA